MDSSISIPLFIIISILKNSDENNMPYLYKIIHLIYNIIVRFSELKEPP